MMTNAHPDTALCARSPAKINLSLKVLNRRSDGFHEIRSIVLGVDLCDELRFEAAGASVTLTCEHPALSADASNLVLQAATALARTGGCTKGARIHLTKRIPLGAGLGGGSSNAATTLVYLNRLWGLDLADDELSRIGAAVGSDVPLFFSMPSARISGRGETVQRIGLRWSGYVLLVFAGCAVSTKAVYEAWSPGGALDNLEGRIERIAQAETADQVMELCSNDLEAAIFRVSPPVEALYDAIRGAGASQVRISGAGQTAYVLFDDPEEAEPLRDKLVSSGIGTGAVVARSLTAPLTGCEDDSWKSRKFVSS